MQKPTRITCCYEIVWFQKHNIVLPNKTTLHSPDYTKDYPCELIFNINKWIKFVVLSARSKFQKILILQTRHQIYQQPVLCVRVLNLVLHKQFSILLSINATEITQISVNRNTMLRLNDLLEGNCAISKPCQGIDKEHLLQILRGKSSIL